MADMMTPGNRLYIYRLLANALGFGNQVTIARAEEILAADDVQAADVGFSSVQAMLESSHFAGAARIDVFKKGRVLLTMLPNPELSSALEQAESAEEQATPEQAKPAERPKGGAPKGKGGMVKQKINKSKTPAKETVRPTRPGEHRRRMEAKEAKAAAEAAARALAEEQAAAAAREAARLAEEKRLAQEKAAREAAERAAQKAREAQERARKEAAEKAAIEQARRDSAERAAAEQFARVTTPIAARQTPALRVTYDPYVGTAPARPQAAAGAAPMPAARPAPRPAVNAATPAPEQLARAQELEQLAPQVCEVPFQAEEPEVEVAQPEVAQPEVVAAQPAIAAAQPAAPLEQPAFARPAPASATQRQTPSASMLNDYPRTISRDVFCPTPLMSTLSRILPVDIDPMALLDEDWDVARATGMVTGSRSRATFPLRYLREDGSQAVEITIRHRTKPGSSVRWEMAFIDGDDGNGDIHTTTVIEGLPLADEGAWGDLAAPGRWRAQAGNPIVEFARFAIIGTWDAILGSLARMAAPERWNYPGTPIMPSAAGNTRYGILREYLATTFHRVRAQNKLVEAASGTFAAFNTGLASAAGEPIHACFEATGSNIPWRFVGFAPAGSGDLGRRIASELDRTPEAATYLSRLDDIMPPADARLVLDHRTLLGDCLGRLPRGFLRESLADMDAPSTMIERLVDPSLTPAERSDAQTRLGRFVTDAPVAYRRLARALEDAAELALATCQRSYRHAAPAFDPASDRMKLLLPLCLVNGQHADVALVCERQPSGAWQGICLMTPQRAYAVARVVSAEQPGWLDPQVVLA